jgi:hypothetical protein
MDGWMDEYEGVVLVVHSFVNYTVKTARTPIHCIIDFNRLQPFIIDSHLNRFILPFHFFSFIPFTHTPFI